MGEAMNDINHPVNEFIDEKNGMYGYPSLATCPYIYLI